MSASVNVLVVASPAWLQPTKISRLVDGAASDEQLNAMVNDQAAITYANLAQVAKDLASKGAGEMVLHTSDLRSEVLVRSLWEQFGGKVAPSIETTWEKDPMAGFKRVDSTLRDLAPFIVVTFGVNRSSLVEHAVAQGVASGIHVYASEWTPANGLERRGWITATNIESFYPLHEDANRWTAWQRIQRTGVQTSIAFDLTAIKAASEAYAPHHFDGHVDRCNKCGVPKHKGRCKNADLVAFQTA